MISNRGWASLLFTYGIVIQPAQFLECLCNLLTIIQLSINFFEKEIIFHFMMTFRPTTNFLKIFLDGWKIIKQCEIEID